MIEECIYQPAQNWKQELAHPQTSPSAPFEPALQFPEGFFPSSDFLAPSFCICSIVLLSLSPLMACSLDEANSGFHSPFPVLALSMLSDLWRSMLLARSGWSLLSVSAECVSHQLEWWWKYIGRISVRRFNSAGWQGMEELGYSMAVWNSKTISNRRAKRVTYRDRLRSMTDTLKRCGMLRLVSSQYVG